MQKSCFSKLTQTDIRYTFYNDTSNIDTELFYFETYISFNF